MARLLLSNYTENILKGFGMHIESQNGCSLRGARWFPADLPVALPHKHLPVSARGRLGLTLVEVMIAMLILVISFSTLLATFSMARRSTLHADQTMEMMHEARMIAETIKTNRYGSSTLSVGTHNFSGGNYVVSLNGAFTNTKDVVITLNRTAPVSGRSYSFTVWTSISSARHK